MFKLFKKVYNYKEDPNFPDMVNTCFKKVYILFIWKIQYVDITLVVEGVFALFFLYKFVKTIASSSNEIAATFDCIVE